MDDARFEQVGWLDGWKLEDIINWKVYWLWQKKTPKHFFW